MSVSCRRSARCLVAALATVGILALLACVVCIAFGWFVVRQQKVYEDPDEVRTFASTFCDLSLLEGFEPDGGISFGLFGMRMNIAGFKKPVGDSGVMAILVGRTFFPAGMQQSATQVRQSFTTRRSVQVSGRVLREQYYVRREVDGETIHIWVALYGPADQSVAEQSDEAKEKTQEPSEETAAEPKAKGKESPLIPVSKEGDWVVVMAVRELADGAAMVQLSTPRSEWDEDFLLKVLMSIR